MRHALCALSFLSAASLAQAADFQLGLSNTTVAADYTSQPIGQGLEFTGGALHRSSHGDLGTLGLQVSQQVSDAVKLSVGGKAFFALNDTKNASGLGLGGLVDVSLPALPALHLGAHAWFAPKVTSASSTKNFQDLGAYIGYRMLSNAEVFAAYRHVRYAHGPAGTDFTVVDGGLFGLKLVF